MFGNAPRALWSRWTPADEHNRIALACRALLVREPGRLILFEAGIGAFFSPKLRDRFGVVESEHVLVASLQAHGITPEDIDVVVLSHLHFDHAGGLLTTWSEANAPALVFEDAQYVVGEAAWQRAQAPHARDRASFIPALNELLADCGRLEVVAGDSSDTLGPTYRLHRSDGHTPGMLLTEITMPAGPVVFAADLIPGTPWIHLPITMGYDRFPERLIDEKAKLLERLAAENGRLFLTHDPTVALCGVTRDDRGRYGPVNTVGEFADLNE